MPIFIKVNVLMWYQALNIVGVVKKVKSGVNWAIKESFMEQVWVGISRFHIFREVGKSRKKEIVWAKTEEQF